MVQVTSSPVDQNNSVAAQGTVPIPGNQNQCDDDKNQGCNTLTDNDIKEFISNFKNLPTTEDTVHVLRQMLDTSIAVNNKLLATQIAHVICCKIDKNNAVAVLMKLPTSKRQAGRNFEPSAPPLSEHSQEEPANNWGEELFEQLRQNCLEEIEKNADFILKQDEILKLPYNELSAILSSDTLEVSSELQVYQVVVKRAKMESKRTDILRDLIHCPRYGLMSEKEFMSRTVDDFKGPDRSGLLDEQEIKEILAYIRKRRKSHSPEELPHKASKPRGRFDQSKDAVKVKKCDKFVVNFLTCWTAVFD